MEIKLVAIGNSLMGDDGIALIVAKSIKEQLEQKKIMVVIGETDVDYCANEVVNSDIIFILDSTYFGTEPGSVSINTLEDMASCYLPQLSLHGMNLIMEMQLERLQSNFLNSNKDNNESKLIYIIGIEIYNIEYNLKISKLLSDGFNKTCEKVVSMVMQISKKYIKQ